MTIEKPASFLISGDLNKSVPFVTTGSGVYVNVRDEKTNTERPVLDAVTGAAVGALGWGDESVVDMVTQAAKESVYSFPAILGNDYAHRLAEFYINHSPPNAFAAALWTGSGSESNENALKIIYQYFRAQGKTKKTKFISRMSSYHGFTIGALSIGDSSRATYFSDILLKPDQCLKMPECHPYRYKKDDETLEDYTARLLTALEDMIISEDPETIAAVIVETLPGSSLGTCPPPAGYLLGIRKLCDKYDILFHLDEVMCGTGRCNDGGLNCWENFLPKDQGPDIQTVGKTLGSGYVTIAGVLISPKVKSVYTATDSVILGAQTYHGHGFNCSVALKIQEKILKLNLTSNMFKMGNLMGEQLSARLLGKSKITGDVRGIGGFWSIEFVKDTNTKECLDVNLDIGHRVQNVCFANGLNVMGMQGTFKSEGDHIVLAPAFVVTEEDIANIVEICCKSIFQVEEALALEGVI
jgi:adenosylmethionine-8-amino-7-oxononanoate aminotransferase